MHIIRANVHTFDRIGRINSCLTKKGFANQFENENQFLVYKSNRFWYGFLFFHWNHFFGESVASTNFDSLIEEKSILKQKIIIHAKNQIEIRIRISMYEKESILSFVQWHFVHWLNAFALKIFAVVNLYYIVYYAKLRHFSIAIKQRVIFLMRCTNMCDVAVIVAVAINTAVVIVLSLFLCVYVCLNTGRIDAIRFDIHKRKWFCHHASIKSIACQSCWALYIIYIYHFCGFNTS